jgi:hypothetical protein
MMVGCIFWRKKRRRPQKDPDLEMKLRRRPRETQETSAAMGKESRAKAKIWARATARWKANARARQRDRRRNMARGTLSHSSTVSLQETQDTQDNHATSSAIDSRSASQLSSQSPSMSEPRGLSTPSVLSLTEAPSPRDDVETPIPSTPPPPEHSDPPAYHQRQSLPDIHTIAESSGNAGHSRSDSSSKREQHEHSSNISYTEHSPRTEEPIPYSPSTNVAHVATDDKTLLAHMADLASAPPNANSDVNEGQSTSREVSAPVWHDEELGDFPEVTRTAPVHSSPCTPPRSPTPSPFPPPPSKGKMSEFYDYPYSFEELGNDVEPSAPPFEEHVSAPIVGPCDGPEMTPSAPPLENDGQYGDEDLLPSAPDGDEDTLNTDHPIPDRTGDNHQDHGRERNTNSGHFPRPSGTTDALLPQNGIPPIYHP